MYFKKIVTFSSLCLLASATNASTQVETSFRHPFYIGIAGGYGATTWNGLVPSRNNASIALNMSTPIRVTEGGFVWGMFTGYELNPFFALEGGYMQYPDAKIKFDSMSIFSFDNDGKTSLSTQTEVVTFMGKVMLFIPNTDIRFYSSFGIADVHRDDEIAERWRVSPSFGVGFNYNLTEHIMGELGANYIGGYGESELNPVENYIPFLYSVFLRLAYKF